MDQLPLIYSEWKETEQQAGETLAQVLVDQHVLFLRKLVNATIIRNQIYQHTSNESDEKYSYIYLQPFSETSIEEKEAIEQAVFSRHDVAPRYEAEYWTAGDHSFICRQTQRFELPLDAAMLLLDHFIHLNGIHYEYLYAVLDPARRKLLLFLKRTVYNP
ncbi:hypothetical protein [Ammoniphilus sp. CFH 90114]|uniref:hypothetical protein n=1 Tax=Ammoniphilus sp. CFH 90114 TaxID=2493665 RepID=UPI00100E64CB|nr:hypothetical protein [Ammoniphilus sp. CFH 90114]RXT07868.1 hypothetical protein EIZ39_10610 [Ammoniphilus sp. CFH 90114]